MTKLKVKPEGRPDMWVPEKASLKAFIEERGFEKIHNFIPTGMMMLGADHSLESVLGEIEAATRMAVFTDPRANMGHSLALIFGDHTKGDKEELQCYDIGRITRDDLEIEYESA